MILTSQLNLDWTGQVKEHTNIMCDEKALSVYLSEDFTKANDLRDIIFELKGRNETRFWNEWLFAYEPYTYNPDRNMIYNTDIYVS